MTKLRQPGRMGVRRIVWAAILFAVASCATDGPVITRPQVFGRYDTNEIQWAGGGRDFKVVVLSNPSDLSKEAFEQAVIDSIQNKITFMQTNFTTTPGPSARQQYRVTFMFDAPVNISGAPLCDPNLPRPEPAPQPGTSVVLGAFCLHDRRITEARGTTATAQPGDPRFEALMTQLIRTILPNSRRNRQEACLPPLCL